jgi:hypothetical protein
MTSVLSTARTHIRYLHHAVPYFRAAELRFVADVSRPAVGQCQARFPMSTIAQEPARSAPERRHWSARILVREMWASLAISVMWLAVLFAAVFAPDIVSASNDGNSTTIPSGVAVALFAVIGTRAVAKYGFGPRGDERD